jgi:hypothetical protein
VLHHRHHRPSVRQRRRTSDSDPPIGKLIWRTRGCSSRSPRPLQVTPGALAPVIPRRGRGSRAPCSRALGVQGALWSLVTWCCTDIYRHVPRPQALWFYRCDPAPRASGASKIRGDIWRAGPQGPTEQQARRRTSKPRCCRCIAGGYDACCQRQKNGPKPYGQPGWISGLVRCVCWQSSRSTRSPSREIAEP